MHDSGTDGWGVDRGFWGTDGQWHDTPRATQAALREAMGGGEHPPEDRPVWTVPEGWGDQLLGPCRLVLEDGADLGVVTALPPDLPIGRHRLHPTDGGPTTLLLVRPRRCHPPGGRGESRLSALAVQAYAARSSDSWGIGDLRDVRRLGTWVRRAGVDLLALSPLHAPAPGDHPQPSPYYPASRRHLNPLHLCVDEVDGATRSRRVDDLAARARDLLADRRLDRTAAWAAKREALEHLFEGRGTAIDAELAGFRRDRGQDLDDWAVFCAISEVHPGPWQAWPEELRHPRSPAVARFASAHADRVRFHAWLQWLADRQLAAAADACPLVTDLAVGVDPGGADAWIDQDLMALDARVGAPPDDFNRAGQDWGLPPYIPHRLRDDGYETLARTMRAVMRHGAGIRIDHVLGLFRLYWIPSGADPTQGAYVRYPADDLLAVLAIESVRAGCFVVGEDLGTVEEGMRSRLASAGVLGTRLVWFEDEPPSRWPSGVLGAVTTHDLPTVAGLWTGADTRDRLAAGLSDDGTGALRERLGRVVDLPDDAPAERVTAAAHRAVAASPVQVAVATLEDVVGVEERPNMPGTVDEWPNWSLALPTQVDDLVAGPPPPALRILPESRQVPARPRR